MPNGQSLQQPQIPPQQSLQQVRETLYINFFSEVNPASVSQLIGTIQQGLRKGKKKFYLLISSTGGNLMSGITAYNFLKSISEKIITYNYAYTDSVALVLFCVGSERYCLPNARFLLHEVSSKVQGSERQIKQQIRILDKDINMLVSIIAETSGQKKEKIIKDMSDGISLYGKEAVKYGLVQEIKDQLPDLENKDSVIISIFPPRK